MFFQKGSSRVMILKWKYVRKECSRYVGNDIQLIWQIRLSVLGFEEIAHHICIMCILLWLVIHHENMVKHTKFPCLWICKEFVDILVEIWIILGPPIFLPFVNK